MTSANWKQLTGFVKYDGSTTVQDKLSSADNLVVPVGTSSSRTGIPVTAPMESSQVPLPDDDFDISHDSHESVQVSEGDIALESHDETIAPSAGTSSRGRARKMSKAMQDSVSQRSFYGKSGMHYMGNKAQTSNLEDAEEQYIKEHDEHLSLQERMRHPIAFHAEMMGDIMYFHQALQQPDAGEFVKAVIKERNGHIENKRWKLIKRSEVPKDVDVIPSVWSMRRKRNLTTNEVTKYKSRLNLHGGKQVMV